MTDVEQWLKEHGTHTCPTFGGRFNGDRCHQRRAILEKAATKGYKIGTCASFIDPYCKQCDGPVKIEESA
jgi:hypothetical protein